MVFGWFFFRSIASNCCFPVLSQYRAKILLAKSNTQIVIECSRRNMWSTCCFVTSEKQIENLQYVIPRPDSDSVTIKPLNRRGSIDWCHLINKCVIFNSVTAAVKTCHVSLALIHCMHKKNTGRLL